MAGMELVRAMPRGEVRLSVDPLSVEVLDPAAAARAAAVGSVDSSQRRRPWEGDGGGS